jgi:hypothetical protein
MKKHLIFASGLAAWMVLCAYGAETAPAAVVPAAKPEKPGSGPLYQGVKQKPVNFREPAREYKAVPIKGWTIQVEKQLIDEEPDLAKKAVERLAENFNEALALFPEASRDRLKKLPLFLMYGPKSKGDGRDNGFEYFQARAPECYNTLDTRWGNSIVAYCAANYVWQSKLWALKLPIHEMAHAYHLGQWAENYPAIVQAYENAMKRNLYRNVRTDQKETKEKAYAIQNPMEYFAELSCMYFAGCDYSPRNRKELEAYDPEGYAMIRELWGIKE